MVLGGGGRKEQGKEMERGRREGEGGKIGKERERERALLPGREIYYLLLLKISTGEPSPVRPGHPLNCQAGPATNTATTCFLWEGDGEGRGWGERGWGVRTTPVD